jgi:hypothetical protein
VQPTKAIAFWLTGLIKPIPFQLDPLPLNLLG